MNTVIYSHSSVIHQLSQPDHKDLVGSCFVELSSEPNFALALGLETPPTFPGISAMLGGGISLDDLAVEHDYLPVSIVLAPGATVAAQSAVSAVAMIPEQDANATLLFHIDDATNFRGVLAHTDKVAVLWDLGDPPSAALTQLAEYLQEEDLLNDEQWLGFRPYRTPGREYSEDAVKTLEEIFGPLGV